MIELLELVNKYSAKVSMYENLEYSTYEIRIGVVRNKEHYDFKYIMFLEDIRSEDFLKMFTLRIKNRVQTFMETGE